MQVFKGWDWIFWSEVVAVTRFCANHSTFGLLYTTKEEVTFSLSLGRVENPLKQAAGDIVKSFDSVANCRWSPWDKQQIKFSKCFCICPETFAWPFSFVLGQILGKILTCSFQFQSSVSNPPPGRKLDRPISLFDARGGQHIVEIWEVCASAPLPPSASCRCP